MFFIFPEILPPEAPKPQHIEQADRCVSAKGCTPETPNPYAVTFFSGTKRPCMKASASPPRAIWSRSGQVSRAGGMVQVTCIIRPDRLDGLLEAAFQVVERHIGVVCVTDCDVLRAERF